MIPSTPETVVPFPAPAGVSGTPDRSAAKRWQHEALFDHGFVMTPTFFLRAYAHLKPFCLTHGEAMFVIHVMQYKWDEQAPFPSYPTIARQMGVSAKSAQRYAASLEQKKFLKRESRTGATNRFDLTPLFDALKVFYVQQLVAKTAPRGSEVA